MAAGAKNRVLEWSITMSGEREKMLKLEHLTNNAENELYNIEYFKMCFWASEMYTLIVISYVLSKMISQLML